MRFDVLTIFPEMFAGPLTCSMIARAAQAGLVSFHWHQIRDHAEGRHRPVDDYPFGGGPGMVMKPEPLFRAVEAAREAGGAGPVVLLGPRGELLRQELAAELARLPGMILVCGHYEGIDERVRERLADREISIGDYVLTGGELPAMVLIDAVVRLLPGVLGAAAGTQEESFAGGLLEYPQYTRPQEFRGLAVPETLLSGDHARIARWRREQALEATRARRPDLLARAALSEADRAFLARSAAAEATAAGGPAAEESRNGPGAGGAEAGRRCP